MRSWRMDIARSPDADYALGLARACAGGLIFGFPLLMTMEMWELGFYLDRARLALFFAVVALVVFGLSRFAGFRDDSDTADDVLDTLAALLVGIVLSASLLFVFGLIEAETSLREALGMIAIQAAPTSIGAIVANKQLSLGGEGAQKEDRAGYLGQLFLMAAGALFFAFNVAPTEEMILIGFKMTPWRAVALVVLSLVVLHALVFTVGFAGQRKHESQMHAFLHFTLAGFGVAMLVSVYVLWTFGRLDGGLSEAVSAIVVLSLPAAAGAALARLVV